jgi:hypothetical protein
VIDVPVATVDERCEFVLQHCRELERFQSHGDRPHDTDRRWPMLEHTVSRRRQMPLIRASFSELPLPLVRLAARSIEAAMLPPTLNST